MSTSAENRATELREECVRILCGQEPKNKKMFESVFGADYTKKLADADSGVPNGEIKLLTLALTYITDGGSPAKKRGRPPKAKADDGTPKKRRGRPPKAKADGTTPAKKRRGRPPKVKATPALPPPPEETTTIEPTHKDATNTDALAQ